MERSFRTSVWHGLLLCGLLGAPGAALAADNGVYLGLASSDVSSDFDVGSSGAGDASDDSGFKGIVGFRPRGVARWDAFRGYRNVLRKAFERWSPSSSPSSS
jgi:hypothetical protein